MFRPGNNPYNNCVVYSDYYYITPYNQYKVLDSLQCPDESKYMVKTESKSYCIYDCKADDTYKYLYNGVCLKECPDGTYNVNYICKEIIDECNLGENDMDENFIVNQQTTETLVRTFINEFNYTKNHVSLYTNKAYTIIIYENRECVEELSLEMPKVDFKDCYEKVKSAYHIEEELIMVIINKKDKNGGQTYYSFFHPISGFKLDADEICKDETIVVSQNLTSILTESSQNFELQSSLTDQGINIFDLNDPFYTDLCYDFENPYDRDIPLSERISTIYPDVELCDEGCQMDGIDLETMTASCNCQFNDISNSNAIKDNALLDSVVGEVFDLISASNILVMTCYGYIFKYFSKSIGGVISTVAVVGHIVSSAIYFIVGRNLIKKYIYNLYENFLSFIEKAGLAKNAPPKKSIKNEKLRDKLMKSKKDVHFSGSTKEVKKIKINRKENDNHSDWDKRKIKIEKPPTENKYDIKSTYNDIIKFRETSTQRTETENIKLNTRNKKHLIKNSKVDSSTRMKKYMNTDDELNKKEDDYQQFFDEYLATSLDDLEYDDAIVKDHRTFCEYFVECLKERQMIAFTFIATDPLKIRIIKIILFILNIMLYFVVTGLFFSEDYIGELYSINVEDDGFFDYIPRSIDKFVYTTMVSVVIGYFIDCFFVEEKKIKGIFRREKENLFNLRHEIVGFIKEIQTRYLVFIIVIFVLLLISFYYLLCFNYVYPKTQMEWVKASITIFIIMQILSFLKCFLGTCLRFLSFKCESERIYKISKFFD